MKLRTIALMAASGLLIASFAYAEAAKTLTADDTSALGGIAANDNLDTLASNSNNNDTSSAQSNNLNSTNENLGLAPVASSSNSNDDISADITADTATGDDDY